jgi:GNAT superfamily N-acetyltransferase
MILPSTFLELEAAPEWPALLAEYAAESAVEGMPPPTGKMETYRALNAGGVLHVFAAWNDGALAGFIFVLAAPLPHYSVVTAVSESFFVAKAHRHTGAGLKLLRAAEDKAREIGSPGLVVSAPFAGRLFKVLPRCGYGEVSRIFFKKMTDA